MQTERARAVDSPVTSDIEVKVVNDMEDIPKLFGDCLTCVTGSELVCLVWNKLDSHSMNKAVEYLIESSCAHFQWNKTNWSNNANENPEGLEYHSDGGEVDWRQRL